MDNGTAHHENPDVLYHELSTSELVDRAQRGDAPSIEQLYYNHRDHLLKFVWLVSGNHDLAIEAVNHAFEQLFEQLASIDADPSVAHLLYREAVSHVNDRELDPIANRSNWELTTDSIAGEGDWTGPGSPPELSPNTEQFIDCFSSLPEPLRLSAGLRLVGSFSMDEVMEISNESADVIRARMDEALRRLRVCLQEDDARTHPSDCSMAGERTWLQFVTGPSNPSSSSDLTAHREQCEECQVVFRGIQRLVDRVRTFRDLKLAPFPKGDESDLLEAARRTAVQLTDEQPDGPAMDPDLKQVLYLIPWGLALVLVISIAPLLVHQTSSDQTGGRPATNSANRFSSVPVYLDANNSPVKMARLRISSTGGQEFLDSIRAAGRASVSSRRTANGSDTARTEVVEVTITFSPPFPEHRVRVLNIDRPVENEQEPGKIRVDVLEATDENGNPIAIEAGAGQ